MVKTVWVRIAAMPRRKKLRGAKAKEKARLAKERERLEEQRARRAHVYDLDEIDRFNPREV